MAPASSRKKDVKWVLPRVGLSVLVFLPVIIYISISMNLYGVPAPEKAPWVSWHDDPSTAVYISWETAEPETNVMKYGKVGENYPYTMTENKPVTIHHVNVTGLEPGESYEYQVLDSGGTMLGSGTFRTAPPVNTSFEFVMFSDTQQHITPGHHWRIARAIKDKNYSFAAIVGDLVSDGEEKEHYDNFFQVAAPYLENTPLVPVIGNHDEAKSKVDWNNSWFHSYFVQRAIPGHRQFFYSFNYSNVHFTICHFAWAGNSDFSTEHVEWLQQDLASSQDKTFRIVMFHCPITGAGGFGPNDNLMTRVLPILQENNVTLLVGGHEHHYERGHLGPVAYTILGGGGGLLDLGMKPMEETEFLISTPCYTVVKVNSTGLAFTTRSPDGALLDQYQIHANGGHSQ